MSTLEKGCSIAVGALVGAVLVAGVIGFVWAIASMLERTAEKVAIACVYSLETSFRAYGFLLHCFVEVMRWFLGTFVPVLRSI